MHIMQICLYLYGVSIHTCNDIGSILFLSTECSTRSDWLTQEHRCWNWKWTSTRNWIRTLFWAQAILTRLQCTFPTVAFSLTTATFKASTMTGVSQSPCYHQPSWSWIHCPLTRFFRPRILCTNELLWKFCFRVSLSRTKNCFVLAQANFTIHFKAVWRWISYVMIIVQIA